MVLSIILLLIVLPLLCIAALMIMIAKRLQEYDGGIKATLMRVIKNILTSVLVLNYIYYIMIGIEYLTYIISESYFYSESYNDPILPYIFLYFLILIVSVLILLCNLIRVIVKKKNGSWKRILLYILICLISLIEFMIIPMFDA